MNGETGLVMMTTRDCREFALPYGMITVNGRDAVYIVQCVRALFPLEEIITGDNETTRGKRQ
jgi:hypothetical protein